jgi:hypothetical protein
MARGWDTQALAREQIARLTGWRIPQSVYAEWESGRRLPSEANLDRLRSFYGNEETGPALSDGAGMQLVVEAIDRQTAAIVAAIQGRDLVLEGLLTELGSYRRSQLDFLRTLQESAPRAEPMPPDEPERPAHDVPATRAARR